MRFCRATKSGRYSSLFLGFLLNVVTDLTLCEKLL